MGHKYKKMPSYEFIEIIWDPVFFFLSLFLHPFHSGSLQSANFMSILSNSTSLILCFILPFLNLLTLFSLYLMSPFICFFL